MTQLNTSSSRGQKYLLKVMVVTVPNGKNGGKN